MDQHTLKLSRAEAVVDSVRKSRRMESRFIAHLSVWFGRLLMEYPRHYAFSPPGLLSRRVTFSLKGRVLSDQSLHFSLIGICSRNPSAPFFQIVCHVMSGVPTHCDIQYTCQKYKTAWMTCFIKVIPTDKGPIRPPYMHGFGVYIFTRTIKRHSNTNQPPAKISSTCLSSSNNDSGLVK